MLKAKHSKKAFHQAPKHGTSRQGPLFIMLSACFKPDWGHCSFYFFGIFYTVELQTFCFNLIICLFILFLMRIYYSCVTVLRFLCLFLYSCTSFNGISLNFLLFTNDKGAIILCQEKNCYLRANFLLLFDFLYYIHMAASMLL